MQIRRDECVNPDKSADQCAMRAYAEHAIDHLALAAREGYDVAGAVLDHLAQRVSLASQRSGGPPWCDTPVVFRIGCEEFSRAVLEERKAPGLAAFKLRDHVVAHCAQIEMPSSVKLGVERISHFRMGPGEPWYTAVAVILRSRHWDPRVIIFRVSEKERAAVNEEFEIEVYIRLVDTGEVRRFREVQRVGPAGWSDYIWSEGNYACDCNRFMFFERAVGNEPHPGESRCGDDRFCIDRIVRVDTGMLLYSESEDEA